MKLRDAITHGGRGWWRRLALALLCPPLYCATRGRWLGGVVSTPWWLFCLWIVAAGAVGPGLGLWLVCGLLALVSDRALIVGGIGTCVVMAVAITLYPRAQMQSEGAEALARDQATMEAMRAAIAGHRAAHGQFPADRAAVETLVVPVWRCAGQAWTYDPATGAARLTMDTPHGCARGPDRWTRVVDLDPAAWTGTFRLYGCDAVTIAPSHRAEVVVTQQGRERTYTLEPTKRVDLGTFDAFRLRGEGTARVQLDLGRGCD